MSAHKIWKEEGR